MNKETWDLWKASWQTILYIAKKRNWDIINDLVIEPPVNQSIVDKTLKELNISLPADFIDVITNYSSGVKFYFQIKGKHEGDYRQIFQAGYEGLWSFEDLKNLKEQHTDWIKDCFDDPTDEYGKVWYNKTPFIRVGNGDFIAFDTTTPGNEYPVVYLSHDDGNLHGKRLGYNFVDFITRWSNIGCFGPEDWQLEPFYDSKENILLMEGYKVENWKKWLTSE